MAKIRIATFNCENLFARYKFNEGGASGDGFTINETSFDILSTRAKRLTAKAIKEADADIICLQEVENLPVLDRFNSQFLGWSRDKRYRYKTLVDGNDPRKIDVAFLSRIPPVSMRSSRHLRNAANSYWLFSRDCLRADFEVGGEILSLYGNHFKSMMDGRRDSRPRRLEQAEGVKDLIEADYGPDLDGNVVVLGDLNDYPQRDQGTTTALNSLLDHSHLVNPLDRLPRRDRWTHFWARQGEYRQLDYIFLSKQLDDSSNNPAPERVLQGLPWRAEDVDDERFEDVGHDNPKASDHVPLVIDLEMGN